MIQTLKLKLRQFFSYSAKELTTWAIYLKTLPCARRPIVNRGLVSVVVPTLCKEEQANHFPSLKKLLSQYLPAQTYSNYEALVCLDGANEAVEAMVAGLHDSRVRLLRSEQTLGEWGHPQTRLGIKKAEGVFFVRINDDNKPYPNYLRDLMECFDEETGFVYGRIVYRGIARKVHASNLRTSYVLPRDDRGEIKHGNIDSMNYITRMDLAKKYVDQWNDNYGADWEFIRALVSAGVRGKFLNRVIGEKF